MTKNYSCMTKGSWGCLQNLSGFYVYRLRMNYMSFKWTFQLFFLSTDVE